MLKISLCEPVLSDETNQVEYLHYEADAFSGDVIKKSKGFKERPSHETYPVYLQREANPFSGRTPAGCQASSSL